MQKDLSEKNEFLLRLFFEKVYTNRNVSIRDFDDFPNIPGIKKSNLQPLHFNNVAATAYYCPDDLPQSIKFIEEVKGKNIVYMLLLKTNGGMPYFGSTGDFGERMLTHLKDGRSAEKQLYDHLRKEEKFLVKIMGVYDTESEARDAERYYIESYRNLIGEIIHHQSINNFKEMEIRDIIKPYMLNITNNTK